MPSTPFFYDPDKKPGDDVTVEHIMPKSKKYWFDYIVLNYYDYVQIGTQSCGVERIYYNLQKKKLFKIKH